MRGWMIRSDDIERHGSHPERTGVAFYLERIAKKL
jgi:hypothetical protein